MRQRVHTRGIPPVKHPTPTNIGEVWKSRGGNPTYFHVLGHAEGWVETVRCDEAGNITGKYSRLISRHRFGTERGYRLVDASTPVPSAVKMELRNGC